MADLYIAFAGPGESSPKNTRDSIDTWIGDRNVGGFYVPTSIDKRNQPGLANVVGYLTESWGPEEDEDEEDAFETIPTHAMVEKLLEQDGDRYLVVIVGDAEVDPPRLGKLIKQARENDIPVLDLAYGMDEYTVTEETPAEEATPAPESEPERPRRRRRTPASPDEEKPAEEPSEPRRRGRPRTKEENEERAEETLSDLKQQRAEAAEAKAAREEEPPWEGETTRPASEVFPDAVKSVAETAIQQAEDTGVETVRPEVFVTDSTEQFRSLLVVALQGALDALQGKTGKAEETFPYIVDSHGNILRRRGRGKPGRNQNVEYMTKTEAAARGFTEE